MKKVIAFSLFGADLKYCIGAAKNVWCARRWYPDWKCVFWIGNGVPKKVTDYLTAAGAEVIDATKLGCGGMFWRFLAADMPGVERFIARDTDSRIGEREALAVQEWIASGKGVHVMRDHPHHQREMPGGLWGARNGVIKDMAGLILKSGFPDGYDGDQQFLKQVVWPMVKDDSIQHDSCTRDLFPGSKPFPTPLSYENPRFVGEVFDEFDEPRPYDWEKHFNYIAA